MLYHIIVTLLGNFLAQAGRLLIALSCVKGTRGPNKECGTASEKVTGRIQEGLKGVRTCQCIVCLVKLTYKSSGGPKEGGDDKPPRVLITGILAERYLATRKDPESPNMGQAGRLARGNPETNPVTINSKHAGHVAERFSLTLLFSPTAASPGTPSQLILLHQ